MATEVPNFGVPDDTLVAVVIGALLTHLGRIARISFDDHEAMVRS